MIVSDPHPNFELLTEKFAGNITFNEMTWYRPLSPDEHLYEIETDQGPYWVLEIDYISSFAFLQDLLDEAVGGGEFVPAKTPLVFEKSSPAKAAVTYRKPTDWDLIGRYANDQFGSKPYYFSFLIRATH